MKKLFLFLFFLPLVTQAADTLKVDVNAIKKAAQNAGWEADDTWLRQHSAKDFQHLLGARGVTSTDIEFEAPSKAVRSEAGSVDWRNFNGINYVSPMLNQGNCGSCVSFAAVGTMETQMNIAAFGSMMRFSTQALFNCGGGYCDWGWTLGPAANYLKSRGVPDEACFPYTSGATGNDMSCSSACSDMSSRSIRIAGYTRPTSGMKNIEAVKQALAKGPLFTSMTVYTDFMLYKSGVYKHVTGKQEGGHAISIVGYDDTKQALIIRNSWGRDWGMAGFAYISYSDISGIGNDTWLFQAPAIGGFVAVQSPTDGAIVSDSIQVETESTFANLQTVDLTVLDSQKKVVAEDSCTQSTCKFDLNTKTLADGRYELLATSVYSGIHTESQHRYIYVMNQIPQLKLNFQGDGVNLGAPVSGRIVFKVSSESGIAPLTHLKLFVKSGDQVVATKETENILPSMTLGWRTINVPNGAYEIYMVGTQKINDREYTVESNHFNITVKN